MKKKDRKTAGLLAILLGGIGGHHFYMGNIGMGIIYVIFCWTYIPLIIGIIEGISYLTHSDERWDEKYNSLSNEELKSNKEKLYDDLLKYDSLKEKGLIEESEYKEKISEIKKQIKDIENKEKSLKLKEESTDKQEKKDKGNVKKLGIALLILCVVICVLFVFLAISTSAKNTKNAYKSETPSYKLDWETSKP